MFFVTLSIAIIFTACNKERIVKINPADISVITDKAELQKRISTIEPGTINSFKAVNALPITFIGKIEPIVNSIIYHWIDNTTTPATRLNTLLNVNPGGSYVAGIPSFTDLTGEEFSITGAGLFQDGADRYAYFTSHIRGATFGGEVFVVKYDDDNTFGEVGPILEAEVSVYDHAADYNDLTIENVAIPKLWVSGDNNARGAVSRYATLADMATLWNNGNGPDTHQGISSDFSMTEFPLPVFGPSGNSSTLFGNQFWFVAGGTSAGGLVVMDKTDLLNPTLTSRTDVANAKHFDIGEFSNGVGNYGSFLWGDNNFANDNANLRIFYGLPNIAYKDFALPADVTLYGKNAIDIDADGTLSTINQSLFLAMGADGVLKVDVDAVYSAGAASPAVTNLFVGVPGDDGIYTDDVVQYNDHAVIGASGLANGLVVVGNYVYVAWGAAGLVILNKSDLSFEAQYNDNSVIAGSCNYVSVDNNNTPTNYTDDILWVGFGTGGIAMFKTI